MLPQVYWTVICEKEIDKHSRGGRGGALMPLPPHPKYRKRFLLWSSNITDYIVCFYNRKITNSALAICRPPSMNGK